MAGKDCDLNSLVSGAEGILDEIIGNKQQQIGIFESEIGGGAGGKFGFLSKFQSKLGGLIPSSGPLGFIKAKLTKAIGGGILNDVSGLLSNGFSLKKFLKLAYKTMKDIENRSRGDRETYSYDAQGAYEARDEFLLEINSDPDDVIYVAKIVADDLESLVLEREYVLDIVDESIETIESELLKIDSDYYQIDTNSNLEGASKKLLGAILEMGEVEVALKSDEQFFDSSSFSAAQKNVDGAIEDMDPRTHHSFNDVEFSSSVQNLVDALEILVVLDEKIKEQKENIENFIENFKAYHVDAGIDDFMIQSIIDELRSVKEDLDSIYESKVVPSNSFRTSILARLFGIKAWLVSTKQQIIDDIEVLEKIDKENDPENARENLNFLEDFVETMETIVEEDQSSDINTNVKILITQESLILNNANSSTGSITAVIEDIKTRVTDRRGKDQSYIDGNLVFKPRVNPEFQNVFDKLKSGGWKDLAKAIKKGEWSKIAGILSGGKYGFSSFSDSLDCLMKNPGQNLTEEAHDILGFVNNKFLAVKSINSFSFHKNKTAIKMAIEDVQEDIDLLEGGKDLLKTINASNSVRTRF
jgi:hypothetical protein